VKSWEKNRVSVASPRHLQGAGDLDLMEVSTGVITLQKLPAIQGVFRVKEARVASDHVLLLVLPLTAPQSEEDKLRRSTYLGNSQCRVT
jgi:hypothetical protein